jgi:Protein of unknown function (DUF1091)
MFHFVQAISGTTVDKLECLTTPSLCGAVVCNFTQSKENPFLSNFTLGCVLTKPIEKITVRLKHYFMASNKQFVPGLFDTQLDFCALVNSTEHPLLTTFLPNMQQLRQVLHACPYAGEFMFRELSLDGSLFPGMIRKRYKAEVTFQRGKYQPILKVTFYGEYGHRFDIKTGR